MHGERRGIQVNQQKTNQTKIGDEPSATEVGALENDVDAIALKLGKMLKMLDTMLAAEKKYHKSDFNSWTVRDLRASQPESRMDRQLPLKEEQGLQRRPTFTANGGDNILGPKRPQGPQPTGEKTGAATSTSRRRLGRANSHGDSSDTHNQYQYLASEQVQILPDAIKERDQQYAETATAQKQSKKANYAATSRGSRSSQTLDEDNDSDTEIPVYFSSLARICARKQCSQATDEDNESDTEIPVYFSSLARIRVCRPTADLQDATTPTTGYQETTELELSLRESDQDRTSTFGECPTTSSTQPSAEATKSECIPRATKVSEDGATFIHGEQPTTPSGPEAIRMEGECIPGPAAVSDDSASTTNVYPSTDEPTFVVTSSRDEDLNKTIRIHLLGANDDNAIDLVADAIRDNPLHSKRWKEPDKTDAQRMEHQEERDCDMCRSIEFSGKIRSTTAVERCTSWKRHDLPGPEPTTEPVTSYRGIPVLRTREPETKGPTTRSKSRLAATVLQESFQPPTATLPRPRDYLARLACRSWRA